MAVLYCIGGREIEGGGDITDAILIGKFAANATLRLFVGPSVCGDCHHPLEAEGGEKTNFLSAKTGRAVPLLIEHYQLTLELYLGTTSSMAK